MYSRVDNRQHEHPFVTTFQVKKENIANNLEDTLYSFPL